jgi:methylenetetrahydrofolate dehydrogenase (NADP+)/methenyltetrahydrofolate cyclohydrolase
VPAELLDGKGVAEALRREVRAEAAALATVAGRPPGLSVVLVGDDPASETYVRNKARAADEAGIRSETLRLPGGVPAGDLLELVADLNRRDDVDGILVQLPLPRHIDRRQVLEAIDPDKDVDGFHPVNVGRLVAGAPGFVPCTPLGIMTLLARTGVDVAGKEAVVVGRSDIVGKPMALLLLHAHATVTVCHSRTADLQAVTRRADLLVAAIGRAGHIGARHVRPGAVVIDVGMNRIQDEALAAELLADLPERLAEFRRRGTALVGDCHPEVARVAGRLTPVPGGVGPLTIASLLANTVLACRRRRPGR